jgi:hypothetical protein
VDHHHVRGYLLWAIAGLLVVACGLGTTARQVRAQDADDSPEKKWKVIEPDPKAAMNGLLAIFRQGAFDNDEQKEAFVNHYKKAILPKLTTPKFRSRQPWKVDRPDMGADVVGEIRRDLQYAYTTYKGRDGNEVNDAKGEVYKCLASLLVENLPKLAKNTAFHPASRYNAMLIVGEVNSPDTVPILIDIVKDAKQSDEIRVAAMIGLIHQASQKWIADGDTQTMVVGEMIALAATPVPKDDRADGVRWMRGQAADVLGLLGSAGKDNAVAAALLKMIGDGDLNPTQRVRAANALGRLNLSGASLAAGPYLDAVAQLTSELLAVEKQQFNRRRIKGHLQYLLSGVKGADADHHGITDFAKAGEQQRVERLEKSLETLSAALEDPRTSEDVLVHEVEKASDAVDADLKK